MTEPHSNGWWVWTVESPDAESIGAGAIELGASGVEVVSSNRLRIFAATTETNRRRLDEAFAALGGSIVSCEPVPVKNWVQEAQDRWSPLTIGALDIVPVLDSEEEPPPRGKHQLLINPGTGFGTGHHPTTHMVLELLQHSEVGALPHKDPVLDLGTGSGILALGASILFNTTVDAIEVDPLALQNAQRNVALNGSAGSRVNLIAGDLAAARGPYPLSLANIYAEVLCELEPGLLRITAPGGLLIVSGIMTSLEPLVTRTYKAWRHIETRRRGDWVAILYRAPTR